MIRTSCDHFKGVIYGYYPNGTSDHYRSGFPKKKKTHPLTNSNVSFSSLTTVGFVFQTFHTSKCSICELDYKLWQLHNVTAGSVYVRLFMRPNVNVNIVALFSALSYLVAPPENISSLYNEFCVFCFLCRCLISSERSYCSCGIKFLIDREIAFCCYACQRL